MKKIMIVVSDLTGGGAERVATNLATELSKTEKVFLVVAHITNNTYGSTVETIDLKMPVYKGKFKVFWHLELTKKLKRIKQERQVTHCICFLQDVALAGVLSKCNDKVFVSVRNNLSSELGFVLKLKEKITFKYTDYIIALSKMVRKDLIENFGVNPDKVCTIYNPCYVDAIKAKIESEHLSEEDELFFKNNKGHVVLSAGRLVDQKGQWHLIRAFSKVVKILPSAKLIIFGKGPNRDYLEKLIRDYALDDSIRLLGYKSNPYIYMYKADLFAFSSLYEGLGNILVECMACELPVVSVDCKYGPKELLAPSCDLTSCVKEIVYGEYGILVPEMDGIKYSAEVELTGPENMLADAIVDMLQDANKLQVYREKIKTRALDFDVAKITEEWIKIL